MRHIDNEADLITELKILKVTKAQLDFEITTRESQLRPVCTHPNLATSLFGETCPDCGWDNVV